MSSAQDYRDRAAIAQTEADAATLENVKVQALRSKAAWVKMAERAEMVERARAQRAG